MTDLFEGESLDKCILIVNCGNKQTERIAGLVLEAAAKEDKTIKLYIARNITEAESLLNDDDIDILILDAVYKKEKQEEYLGISLVEELREMDKYVLLPVIFITSAVEMREHAYKELNCLSFLPEAFEEDALLKVLRKALQYSTYRDEENYVLLRKSGMLYPIQVRDIVYVEMENRLLFIHLKDGRLLKVPHKTMQELYEEADAACLVQCNKSMLVNRAYVSEINLLKEYLVLRDTQIKIPIGYHYRDAVRQGFQQK